MIERIQTVALALLIGLVPACSGPTVVTAEGFPLVERTIERDADGALVKGRLSETTAVEGLLATSWLHLWPDGVVRSVQLAEAAEVSGHRWPEGSRLWYLEDGTLDSVWLGASAELSALPCRGGGKIAVGLHANGALRSVFLSRDTVIDGVPCKASLMHPVELAPDGRVVACKLSAPYERDAVTWGAGSEVRFD